MKKAKEVNADRIDTSVVDHYVVTTITESGEESSQSFKFPGEALAIAVRKADTGLIVNYGAIMKDGVEVPLASKMPDETDFYFYKDIDSLYCK